MSSLRTKTTLFTLCEVIIAIVTVAVLAIFAIDSYGSNTSRMILELLCETGEKNLDSYFDSIEQSVETVSDYAKSDLAQTDLANMDSHLERVSTLFEKVASNTAGILTYYYRTDPTVTSEPGFWFVDTDGEGFVEHEVTDITQYDTSDQSALVWFTVPKATGRPIWQAPYVTDNLDVYVFSYNVPIYKSGRFVGVIGIEIDYSTVAEEVDNITLYDNGYAFINDNEGIIVYHPLIDVAQLPEDQRPQAPEGLTSEDHSVRYTFEGVDKLAAWTTLDNGMRLNVTVPIEEINHSWKQLVNRIIVVSVLLLLVFVALTRRLMRRITDPLSELTQAAEQLDAGNYDVELTYDGNDEVGILTRTVRQLVGHLKVHMEELNSLAYADPLTHVHNKGAYDVAAKELQASVDDPDESPEFAIGMFDCDYLKEINDQYGHDKGDEYLKASCSLICHVFDHSPVFRIGGDEFAVILQGEDFKNRDELAREFERRRVEQCASTDVRWLQISISAGIATYDPTDDATVEDVSRRADKLMYEAKWNKNAAR